MDPRVRADALRCLKKARQSVEIAESLVQTGDYLPAWRALMTVQQLAGQATAVFFADCLQRAIDEAKSSDQSNREERLDELVRLIGFVESELGPDCRRRVVARLKKGR